MTQMETLITLGVDKGGLVYGLNIKAADNERGWDWERNPAGYSTSCDVIRPVPEDILEYMRKNPYSVRERWKESVAEDKTNLGLEDFFNRCLEESSERVWCHEGWPRKDESFCYELLEDPVNPTLKAGGFHGDDENGGDFRKHVEKLIVGSDAIDLKREDIATWECAGCFPPDEPFVIELAPRWILDEYYAHLAEKHRGFRKNMKEGE